MTHHPGYRGGSGADITSCQISLALFSHTCRKTNESSADRLDGDASFCTSSDLYGVISLCSSPSDSKRPHDMKCADITDDIIAPDQLTLCSQLCQVFTTGTTRCEYSANRQQKFVRRMEITLTLSHAMQTPNQKYEPICVTGLICLTRQPVVIDSTHDNQQTSITTTHQTITYFISCRGE